MLRGQENIDFKARLKVWNMKVWNEVKDVPHDASGVRDPKKCYWHKVGGVYYPVDIRKELYGIRNRYAGFAQAYSRGKDVSYTDKKRYELAMSIVLDMDSLIKKLCVVLLCCLCSFGVEGQVSKSLEGGKWFFRISQEEASIIDYWARVGLRSREANLEIMSESNDLIEQLVSVKLQSDSIMLSLQRSVVLLEGEKEGLERYVEDLRIDNMNYIFENEKLTKQRDNARRQRNGFVVGTIALILGIILIN